MKKQWKLILFIAVMFCFTLNIKTLMAQDEGEEEEEVIVGEVRNLSPTTPHEVGISCSHRYLGMRWEPPDDEFEHYRYYTVFNTDPDYEFDDFSIIEMNSGEGTQTTSNYFSELGFDNVEYYFHIVAEGKWGEIGPTSTAGPYLIDVVPPYDVSVSVDPEVTSSRRVTLNMTATGASQICISEYDYMYDCELVPMDESVRWYLSNRGGDKTLYITFKDEAGNTTDVSATAKLIIPGDVDGDGNLGLVDVMLALKILSGADTGDHRFYSQSDTDGDGKIGIAEAVFILRKIAGTK